MAQTKDYITRHEWMPKDYKCRVCLKEKEFDDLNIFWSTDNKNDFYVCDGCHNIIRGLFIDVMLEKRDKRGIPIFEQLSDLNTQIVQLLESRNVAANRLKKNIQTCCDCENNITQNLCDVCFWDGVQPSHFKKKGTNNGESKRYNGML